MPTNSGSSQVVCTPLSTITPTYKGPKEENNTAPPVTVTIPPPSYTPPAYSIDENQKCSVGALLSGRRGVICISPEAITATEANDNESYSLTIVYKLTDNGEPANSCSDTNFSLQNFSIATPDGAVSPTGSGANCSSDQVTFSISNVAADSLSYGDSTWQITSN
ncbi:MAG TPA: hypothetical protein VGS28_02395 [Candidatus Saccharimonadales bacterium]|nr:hypothetical protein [Candidatus Saccharimonadales bacterium]